MVKVFVHSQKSRQTTGKKGENPVLAGAAALCYHLASNRTASGPSQYPPGSRPMTSETTSRPGLARCAACLCYEALLLLALLLVATAIFTAVIRAADVTFWTRLALRLILLALVFVYFGLSWVRHGQTVAMKAWGIRLVRADGGAIAWAQATLRFVLAASLIIGLPALAYAGSLRSNGHASAPLSLLWALAPFLFAAFDSQRRFLHDRLAGTRLQRVVRPARSR